MADKDREGDGPSLELPSFGFGRKKKAEQPEPVAPGEDAAPPVEPAPIPEPEPEPEPIPQPEPIPEPAPVVRERVVTTETRPTPQPVEPEPTPAPREFSLPAIAPLQAAVVVGALIGLLAVLLTFASLKACDAVRGTDSCGGGPGLLLLVATLVLLTYVGGWLLRGFGIGDPGSTSFLAVGLLAVLTMLFFLDVIYNWWMIIVIPLLAMATYALSWWVTTRFVDLDE